VIGKPENLKTLPLWHFGIAKAIFVETFGREQTLHVFAKKK
jgi:hypothetical protein